MNAVVVDTNVVSYLLANTELGLRYRILMEDYHGHITFATVAELYYGAVRRAWGEKRWAQLEAILSDFAFLPSNLKIARRCGHIVAERERLGRRMRWRDASIAATALHYGLPLITHDGDFRGIAELKVITAIPAFGVAEARCRYGNSFSSRTIQQRLCTTHADAYGAAIGHR